MTGFGVSMGHHNPYQYKSYNQPGRGANNPYQQHYGMGLEQNHGHQGGRGGGKHGGHNSGGGYHNNSNHGGNNQSNNQGGNQGYQGFNQGSHHNNNSNSNSHNDRGNMNNHKKSPSDNNFQVDVRNLEENKETRTTVMVRNIPNKYSQKMLLDEVNVLVSGTYDFFYLPIDFNNNCNMGYAFINFLTPRDVANFIRNFDGKKWKKFISEKVCAVTFARIQGKSSLISRFQNSSLLSRDDHCRPLLFMSSGPQAGSPEPFPSPSPGFVGGGGDGGDGDEN